MPTAIQCPHCRRMLQLRDADVGKMVRCPSCTLPFPARLDRDATLPPQDVADFELYSADAPTRQAVQAKSPPPVGGPREQRRPQTEPGEVYAVQLDEEATASPREEVRRRRRRESQWDQDDDDVQPHRGVLILVLGVLSLVLACFFPAGWILGGISMTMGTTDSRLIDQGVMDRSGRAMTRAGQICGIFGVFFSTMSFILYMVFYTNHLLGP